MPAIAGALSAGLDSGRSRARVQLEVDTTGGPRVLGYGLHVLGKPAIVAMVFTDLTETLDRERRAHAERQVADAGRLASAMAHELKSPLATIGLYVDLLRRQMPAEGPALGNLDVITSELADCQSRLSTILHSMAGAAAIGPGLRLTSLADAIGAIVEEQRLRAPQTELRLTMSGDARVALGPAGLSSIVGNLVSNAVEVGDGVSPVDINMSCGRGVAGYRSPTVAPVCPTATCSRPSSRPRTRARDWALAGATPGTRGGRRCHGGQPRGLRGRVHGAAAGRRPHPAGGSSRARHRRRRARDDRRGRRAARSRMRGRHRAARRGVVDRTASRRFDCAVLDYRLPGIDGVQAANRLPGLPIIVISSDETAAAALATSRRRERLVHGQALPYGRPARRAVSPGGAPVMSVRVIIADDHALWRAGLHQLLEAEGIEVAGEAATGDEALEAVRTTPARCCCSISPCPVGSTASRHRRASRSAATTSRSSS